jgi:acyl-CoA reductase-like NAD-dependent aldehyde dehydrogenase
MTSADVADSIEQSVGVVAGHAHAWAATPPAVRRTLLDQILRDVAAASEDWLSDACLAKGLTPESSEAGEELLAGVVTLLRMVRLLRDALADIEKVGRPRYPGPVGVTAGDRLRVGVVPSSPYDRLAFPQTRAEIWMRPGESEDEARAEQAWVYRDPQLFAGTCLVLGAGNVASLGPRDALYKLFVEGKVVVLKASPVNDYLVPHWERGLRALVERGFLRVVRGGPEVGERLVEHPLVDEVHITGSAVTHDAVVFGSGEDGASRKAQGRPRLDKNVTSELGNVSPVIVVPGRWTSAELVYQAHHLATMLVNNAGFNCLTPRVLITHAGWRQRTALLEALAYVLRSLPTRRAYYPGAEDRRAAFVEQHPEARSVGDAGEGTSPWTLVLDVPPAPDDICFRSEAFCGLMAETSLVAASPTAFVDQAVEFCNEVLWGTLSATVLAPPSIQRDGDVAAALERAVSDLRYGAIGFNIWHAHAFALASPSWGAFPGHPLTDIQSGRGVVGNALMFRHPEKSVLRAPFRARPVPAWFATNPRLLSVARAMVRFEADPGPGRFASLMRVALAG